MLKHKIEKFDAQRFMGVLERSKVARYLSFRGSLYFSCHSSRALGANFLFPESFPRRIVVWTNRPSAGTFREPLASSPVRIFSTEKIEEGGFCSRRNYFDSAENANQDETGNSSR